MVAKALLFEEFSRYSNVFRRPPSAGAFFQTARFDVGERLHYFKFTQEQGCSHEGRFFQLPSFFLLASAGGGVSTGLRSAKLHESQASRSDFRRRGDL